MASPPDLMPELIDQILLRFPPDKPAYLVRALVVCKLWRRLVCDPAFRRRYVAFHRAPPLLGFLHTLHTNIYPKPRPRFVSTIKPSPLPLQAFLDHGCGWDWHVRDSRHGRVLFQQAPNLFRMKLVVLEPASGKQNLLPEPPLRRWTMDYMAAALCAVRGCDHLDCEGGPFLVVLVGFNAETGVLQSHLYSSETSTWSSSAYLGRPGFHSVHKPSVLIGNDIYFLLAFPLLAVLKVNLEKNHLCIINRPEPHRDFDWKRVVVMAMDDGSLGFTAILGSSLILWSRNVVNLEVAGGWARCKVIELQTLITFKHKLRVVGSVEGSGIIFVSSDFGVFLLDLKSCRERRVDFFEPREYEDISIFPFRSFYTPDGASSKLRLPLGPR